MNKLMLCSAAAIMGIAPTVSAIDLGDTVVVSYNSTATLGRTVDWNYDSARAFDSTSITGTSNLALAGLFTFDVIAGGTIQAFCVEVAENFPDDPITYDVTEPSLVPEESPPGPMGDTRLSLVKDLYANFYDDAVTGDGDTSYGNTADEAAAFQLVLWEITHENFTGSTASQMKDQMFIEKGAFAITSFANSNILGIANNMIAALGSGSAFELFGFSNPTNQDLLVVVPSPAIAGLAGLGLAGMRRRRR